MNQENDLRSQEAQNFLKNFGKKERLVVQSLGPPQKEKLLIADLPRFRALISSAIFEAGSEICATDEILAVCGVHVSNLLTDIGVNPPASWFATDYLLAFSKTINPQILFDGGNVCFLLCAVFPERTTFRSMKSEDYINMGTKMFLEYHIYSASPIGFYMANYFEEMVQAAQKGLKMIHQ